MTGNLSAYYFLYFIQFVFELCVCKYLKIKGLDLREIVSLIKSRKVMIMVHDFNHCQK